MTATNENVAESMLNEMFPNWATSCDDGNVHLNVPAGEDCQAAFDRCAAVQEFVHTTDGCQVGTVCVHGEDNFFAMVND